MNGTITSPMYPAVYPKSSVCKYEFIGQNTEKIQVKSKCEKCYTNNYLFFFQISFIDFLLPSDDNLCYYADTLEVSRLVFKRIFIETFIESINRYSL